GAGRALEPQQAGGIEIRNRGRRRVGIHVSLHARAHVQQQGGGQGLIVIDARIDAFDVQGAADGDGVGVTVLPDVFVRDLVGEIAGDSFRGGQVVVDFYGRQILDLVERVAQLVVVYNAVRVGCLGNVAHDFQRHRVHAVRRNQIGGERIDDEPAAAVGGTRRRIVDDVFEDVAAGEIGAEVPVGEDFGTDFT